MNISEFVKNGIGETVNVMELAKLSVAKQHLPEGVQFAAVSTQMMSDGPINYLSSTNMTPKISVGYSQPQINTWDQFTGEKHVGYLYHDGTTLTMKTPEQTIVTITASDVREYGEFDGKFWFTTPAGTYVFGQLVSIYSDNGETIPFRTDVNTNDAFLKELAAVGIASSEEVASSEKSRKTTTIVIIGVAIVGFFIAVVLPKLMGL